MSVRLALALSLGLGLAFALTAAGQETIAYKLLPTVPDQTLDCDSAKHVGPIPHEGLVRLADINRDGWLDLVTGAAAPFRLQIYLNAHGRFDPKPYWESAPTSDKDHVEVVDMNGDGWLDVSGMHETYCTLYFSRAGKFPKEPDWHTGIIADTNQIQFGDFDGDGDLDILASVRKPFRGPVIYVNRNGEIEREPSIMLAPEADSETSVFGDYDLDGDLDIASMLRNRIALFENLGGGKFAAAVTLAPDYPGWTQRLYWQDIDGDRYPELFAARGTWSVRSKGFESFYLKNERGKLAREPAWRTPEMRGLHAFAFGDIDGDGDLDVAGANWVVGGGKFRGGFCLYLNDRGKLAEQPAWYTWAGKECHEIAFGDIDHDGDLDVVAAGVDGVHLFLNRLR